MADLDRDRIATAALAVADERGSSGFTMRAVADALGVTPMALYHHVEDKAALAGLVIDAALGQHPLPPPTGVWQDDMWEMARWLRSALQAHPVIAELRRTYRVWTAEILPMTDRWMSLWQQTGLPLDRAVVAATTSSMAIFGLVELEQVFREMRPPDEAMLAWLPNARLVFQAEHDRDAEFELLVRSVVEGLHHRLQLEADGRLPTPAPPRAG